MASLSSSSPGTRKLLRRGVNVDSGCPLCLEDVESMECLLKGCPIVRKVWKQLTHHWLPIGVSPLGCCDFNQSLGRVQATHVPRIKQSFAFLMWSIWKSRNAVIFSDEIFNPFRCLIRGKKKLVDNDESKLAY